MFARFEELGTCTLKVKCQTFLFGTPQSLHYVIFRRIDPFIGLFADQFVGGTELDGGLITNSLIFVNYLLKRMLSNEDFKAQWLQGLPEANLTAIADVQKTLQETVPLSRTEPQVSLSHF